MATYQTQQRPVRLLSLDGGGIRGMSELVILDHIMRKLRGLREPGLVPRPCEVFDLIGGTSTGGLIALMLGRLRMTVEETINEYVRLAESVFSVRKPPNHADTFKATRLEDAIKDVVKRKGFPKSGEFADQNLPLIDYDDATNDCKIFVCSRNARNMATPRLFRSYPIDSAEQYDNMTIWEAGRATSAAPTFFKRIFIGPKHYQEEFIDGGMGCNNPVLRVIEEAQRLFSDRRLACILSIGTGMSNVTGFAQPGPFQAVLPTKLIKALGEMATDTETVEKEMSKLFQEHPNTYFRLNVDQGLQKIDLDEWKQLGVVKTHTLNYLKHPTMQSTVDLAVQALRTDTPRVSDLLHLNTLGGPIRRSTPCLDNIPTLLVSHFVGQESILNSMRDTFDKHQPDNSKHSPIVVLKGMGGSGKTQIALKYCIQSKELGNYEAVLWVDATSHNSLSQSYVDIGNRIGATSTASGVVESLKKLNFLLVLDNYDDPQSFPNIREFIPSSHTGNIIVTSRHSDAFRLGRGIQVDGMNTEDATELLYSRSEAYDEPLELVKEAVRVLGRLPLAIDQAGSYIAERRLGFEKFLRIFTKRQDVLSKIPEVWEYCKSVAGSKSKQALSVFTTLDLSYNLLAKDETDRIGKAAANLLTLSGFLGWNEVSEFFLAPSFHDEYGIKAHVRKWSLDQEDFWKSVAPSVIGFADFAKWQNSIIKDGKVDEAVFSDVIAKLSKLSLVQKCWSDSRGLCFSLHPVVASWLQYRLNEREQGFFAKYSILTVLCYTDFATWKATPSTRDIIANTTGEYHATLLSAMHNDKFLKDDQKLGAADMILVGMEISKQIFCLFDNLEDAQQICSRVVGKNETRNSNELFDVDEMKPLRITAYAILAQIAYKDSDQPALLRYAQDQLVLVREVGIQEERIVDLTVTWRRCSDLLISQTDRKGFVDFWTGVFQVLHLPHIRNVALITKALKSAGEGALRNGDAEDVYQRYSDLLGLFGTMETDNHPTTTQSHCCFYIAVAQLIFGDPISACSLLQKAVAGFESTFVPDGAAPYSYWYLSFLALGHALRGNSENVDHVCQKVRELKPCVLSDSYWERDIVPVDELLQSIYSLVESKDVRVYEFGRRVEAKLEKYLWGFFWSLDSPLRPSGLQCPTQSRCRRLCEKASRFQSITRQEYAGLRQEVNENLARLRMDADRGVRVSPFQWASFANMFRQISLVEYVVDCDVEEHYETCKRWLECAAASDSGSEIGMAVGELGRAYAFAGRTDEIRFLKEQFPEMKWDSWQEEVDEMAKTNKWIREAKSQRGGEDDAEWFEGCM